MTRAGDDRGPAPRTALLLCALFIGAGAVLRAIPCGNAFWLDEIWTWAMARRLDSALGVLTELRNSNNHPLNTLYFYWIGDQTSWALYRIPALVSGVGTVLLATILAWRRGRARAVAVSVLFSLSFALVQFSSEARGYAPGLFFCFASLLALEADLARPRAASLLGFAACSVLAFLSQLTSLFFLAGAVVYAGARRWQRGERGAALARGVARLAVLPGLAFAAFYAVHLRHLLVEGGEVTRPALVVAQTLGFSLGLPVVEPAAPWYVVAVALLLGGCLIRLWRDGDPLWIFWAVTTLAAPTAVLLALRPQVVALRYFLPGIALSLWVLGDALGRAAGGGRVRAGAVVALLASFVAGNALHAAAFLRYGRGGYLAALEAMAAPPGRPPTRIGSDHDFRTGLTLQFYARYLPEGSQFRYVRYDDWPVDGLDWLIHHGEWRRGEPDREWVDRNGNVYELAHRFEKAGVSGFYWDLYRATGEHR